VARAEAGNTSLAIHILPPPVPAADDELVEPLARMLHFLRATNALLHDFLRSLPSVRALVLDMLCGDALDIAADIGLPAYFFPSGAVGLAVFLALPARRRSMSTSFRELGGFTVLSFPGAPPLKVSKLAQGLADDGEACQAMLRVAARMGGLVQMDKTTRACGGDTKG
jgi:hypothetical protein